jgi:hypothetical protein
VITTTRRPVRMLLRRKVFKNAKKLAPLNLPVSRQKQKFPVSPSHLAKIAYAAPCRPVQQDRVLGFLRNLHLASRTVLLEVHLVGCPEIYRRIFHQRLEFFLCAFCRAGSAWAI